MEHTIKAVISSTLVTTRWGLNSYTGDLMTGSQLGSGIKGFLDLFTTTTGERGDFPVIPDAVGTEPEIY
jgi:hypothetical protein